VRKVEVIRKVNILLFMSTNNTNKLVSRRDFVNNTMFGLGLLSLTSFFELKQSTNKPINVLCVGAHPDDPETGCGGTLAKFSRQGDKVTIIYFTNGQAGIEGKSFKEAEFIRMEEARRACKILGAKPVFLGQIDGNTIVDNSWVMKIKQLLETEKPDILFSHWPIDTHKDHLVSSILVQKAYFQMKAIFPLFFYEVCTGRQSHNFLPTDYVDITDVRQQKIDAVFCHASQGFNNIEYYQKEQGLIEEFRGLTIGTEAAEAFVRLNGPSSMIK